MKGRGCSAQAGGSSARAVASRLHPEPKGGQLWVGCQWEKSQVGKRSRIVRKHETPGT